MKIVTAVKTVWWNMNRNGFDIDCNFRIHYQYHGLKLVTSISCIDGCLLFDQENLFVRQDAKFIERFKEVTGNVYQV